MAIIHPENRTEFITAFKEYVDPNHRDNSIASSRQLEHFLEIALDRLSGRKPAIQEGTITTTAGSKDVPLFADWLTGYLPNERILKNIEQGRNPSCLQEDYSSLYIPQRQGNGLGMGYGGIYGNPYDPINSTSSRPITPANPRSERPNIQRKWVDGVLLPVWILRRATLPTQSIGVTYFARHRVEDGDDNTDSINTLVNGDEHIIFEIMQILCVKGNAFSAFGNGKTSNPLDFLKDPEAEINSILARVTPTAIPK